MTCQRCKGLMVQERFDDVGLGSAGYEVPLALSQLRRDRRCCDRGSSSHYPQNRAGSLCRQKLEETVMAT